MEDVNNKENINHYDEDSVKNCRMRDLRSFISELSR